AFKFDGRRMFGDVRVEDITKQMVHRIYEHYAATSGLESANKIMTAWQAAFKYATLTNPEIRFNPFSQLGRELPRPRRQRWTNEQLDSFVKKAEELGHPAIGRCALMCMELMQRPGDVLSLKWGAYRARQGVWYIRQSKQGVEVWIPPTEKLRTALEI